MKLKAIVPIALIAFSPGFSLADDSVNYRFSGDSLGRQVCRAIIRDDVAKLQQVLRFHRQTLAYRYSFNDTTSQAIAGSFKCNDMRLQDFSKTVGAQQIAGFLATGNKVVSEQVVYSGK
jgi:hypothetical protein